MTEKNAKSVLLTRREAIYRVSRMLGGVALVGQSAMLAACGGDDDRQPPEPESAAQSDGALFSDNDVALMDEIAETILPETDTPGAKAAEVGAFMALMVKDTYYEPDQEIFRAGLETIDEQSNDANGSDFLSATPEERLALLETLDAEQHEYMGSKSPEEPAHFFRMMKELALLGYFTSEIGYTQAMRYTESPGRFDPCTDLEDGGKTWADHA